jgi:hypothetical protein
MIAACPSLVLAQGSDAVTTYGYRSYADIMDVFLDLNATYPGLVDMFDAQSEFGLPSPGSCGVESCKHWVVRITNEASLPDPYRPEVFFSGALHGNERIGPNTVTELALLLVNNYGLSEPNPWLKRLVDTRSIWIMPMTNALGYVTAALC